MPAPHARRFAPALAAFVALSPLAGSSPAWAAPPPSVIVDNGTIMLGVDPGACLNAELPLAAPEGFSTIVGLQDISTNLDGVRYGDPHEGWGIADLESLTSGGAYSLLNGGGTFNLTLVDWGVSGSGTQPASAGRSVFTLHDLVAAPVFGPEGPPPALLRIRHDFHPSPVARLYEIEVTVENLSGAAIRPRYRRLVDWDVEPTPTAEFVTLIQGPSTAVTDSYFTGFQSPDPLVPLGGFASPTGVQRAPEGTCAPDADFIDCGPGDFGAAFDFEFPRIPASGTLKFWLYYGAFPTEAGALAGLDEVGASAFSLGQSATNGTPMTFVLGFKAPWAILDNGTVEIGVDMFGALNVHGGTPSAGGISAPTRGLGPIITGLRDVGTNFESLAGGTPWEGWGVTDFTTQAAGTISLVVDSAPFAPEPSRGGPVPPAYGVNMTPLDLDVFGTGTLTESVGRRAIVTTGVGDPPLLHVTHDLRPSKTPGLYEIVVILENVSGAPLAGPLYRRVADWDIEPTPTSEWITNQYESAAVFESVDDGFNYPVPLGPMSAIFCSGAFVDCGPGDLGMGYSFLLDPIPAGGREQFHLYYGSAANEIAALAALATVGAEAYSLAEPNLVLAPIPEALTPVVFLFGFKDVLFVDDFETADSTRWSSTVPAP